MLMRVCFILAVIVALGAAFLFYDAASSQRRSEPAVVPLPSFPATFPSDLPTPALDMAPDEIVRTILAALRDNDRPTAQAGIATCFNFSSPENQAHTGPLPKFAAMIHQPAYAPLLNHKTSEISKPLIEHGVAAFRVTITDTAGRPATFVFQLSQQPNGQWLTDGVQRIQDGPDAAAREPQKLGT